MNGHLHYILGVSLATGMQPTAIAVIEQEISQNGKWRAGIEALSLRWLERVPLDDGITKTVAQVKDLLKRDEIAKTEDGGGAEVVLDITNSGHAPVELFEGAGIKPLLVTVTGATTIEEETAPNDWRIPNIELVGKLDVLFDSNRLQMADKLDLAGDLNDELNKFRKNPPRINPNDPESWREGQFDDLVFAVAVAAWRATGHVPKPQAVRAAETRLIEERTKELGKSII